YIERGLAVTVPAATPLRAVPDTAGAGYGSATAAAPVYSITNVQVEGVDEDDIVKTNGTHIFVLMQESGDSGTLRVYKAYPPEDLSLSYELDVCGYITSLMPEYGNVEVRVQLGETLRIYKYPISYDIECRTLGLYVLQDGRAIVIAYTRLLSNILYDTRTWLVEVKPDGEVGKVYWVDGAFRASRMVSEEGLLALITVKPSYTTLGPTTPIRTSSGEIGAEKVFLVGYPEVYTIVTVIDLETWSEDTIAYLSSGGDTTLYMTPEGEIYVAASNDPWSSAIAVIKKATPQPLRSNGQEPVEIKGNLLVIDTEKLRSSCGSGVTRCIFGEAATAGPKTLIVHFRVNGASIGLVGSTVIDGLVRKPWQLDEYKGYLRVAADAAGGWRGRVALYVIDSETMEKVSELNITVNERIHGVRFMGDRLYIVTYRNVDPLYVVDLSDPYNPVILGYLKGPGFDEYLHPIGEGYLLGIGLTDDRQLRVTLYRINSDSVDRLDQVVLGDFITPIIYDVKKGHRAFVFDPLHDYALIPAPSVGVLVVKIEGNYSLRLAGILEHRGAVRALYIGDYIYTVSWRALVPSSILSSEAPVIKVFDAQTLRLVASA
ncbi:MAG: beta-propeller domain-containing protein, partial [Desulfurococcales archaeon]|nr:beta-propeller domain-containing protein [Desulfurococcales archaeon]